jgi:hypothetical protein
VLRERDYEKIRLVGKSLGAFLIAQLCSEMPELSQSKAAYLAPPLNLPIFGQLVGQNPQPSFLAIGTKDRYYDEAILEDFRSHPRLELARIEDADHSMNVEGDLAASIEALMRVAREVVRFLKEP